MDGLETKYNKNVVDSETRCNKKASCQKDAKETKNILQMILSSVPDFEIVRHHKNARRQPYREKEKAKERNALETAQRVETQNPVQAVRSFP